MDSALLLAQWDPLSQFLAEHFWPGPLTVILKKNPQKVADIITAGGPTVGLRCPDHPLFLKTLKDLGSPLAAPSANRFGKTSPTTAQHVLHEFPKNVPVVDGGSCIKGLESTVVEVQLDDGQPVGVKVLRPGAIDRFQLGEAIKRSPFFEARISSHQQNNSPGFLKNHYQTETPLILLKPGVHWLSEELAPYYDQFLQSTEASAGKVPPWTPLTLNDQPELAARELYSELRRLNQRKEFSLIVCQSQEHWKLSPAWEAILDRLQKASHFQVEKSEQSCIHILSKNEVSHANHTL